MGWGAAGPRQLHQPTEARLNRTVACFSRVFSSASGLGGIGGHEVGECEADMTVLPGDRETAEEGSSSREGSTEEYGGARSLISILCLSRFGNVSCVGSRPRARGGRAAARRNAHGRAE